MSFNWINSTLIHQVQQVFISKTSVAAQGPFRNHHIAHKTGWNHCFQSDWLAALKHLGFSVHQFLISHPGNKVALTRRQAYKISVVSTLWLIIKDFVWDLVARKQDTLRHNLISPKYQKKIQKTTLRLWSVGWFVRLTVKLMSWCTASNFYRI